MENLLIVVVGSGSVGKRHALNLIKLGCLTCFVDSNIQRARELNEELGGLGSYSSISEASLFHVFSGAIIATPTIYHLDLTVEVIKLGIPVLLEKPITITLEESLVLLNYSKNIVDSILLGYTWRWWPPLIEVKKMLDDNIVGNIIHVHFHMSAHLADWHPWERYQDFFMSKKELGGGALLDESHWIDLMIWFFGMPKSVFGKVDKISNLEITSDDIVDVVFIYDKMHVTMHLDLFSRPHEKSIRFVGSEGTIFWQANPNQVSLSKSETPNWEINEFSCERNDMFMSLVNDFIFMIKSKTEVPRCGVLDGVKVMKVIEAIRESSITKEAIIIDHLSL
jgi:predicted dehydrogenase